MIRRNKTRFTVKVYYSFFLIFFSSFNIESNLMFLLTANDIKNKYKIYIYNI